MTLHLYNTLTRKKEEFKPIDAENVRMYVCGPTVYDRPHLGNARSVVVYDVLYRLLKSIYGEKHVTYVRNITDVDDKINAAAKANNEPISALTARVENWFHADMAALGVLSATVTLGDDKKSGKIEGCMGEPHATHHIPHMIDLIERLIKNGNAYVSEGHVLFAVNSYGDYGALSGRRLDELIAGARVGVESYKKHPGDFVLWKPADADDDASSVFESPWGKGRPGWHIECSAMSTEYLGENFDIHGGGADLMFPHHENEIAQSRCALPGSTFANYWVHNGFLTVNGEKMSKSLGNFVTVRDLLDKGVKGEVIRLAFLKAKYSEPLDWNNDLLFEAKENCDRLYRAYYLQYIEPGFIQHPDYQEWLQYYRDFQKSGQWEDERVPSYAYELRQNFNKALLDDLNTPLALSILLKMTDLRALPWGESSDPIPTMSPIDFFGYRVILKQCALRLGLLTKSLVEWKGQVTQDIENQINARIAAKKAKNFAEADRIRKELADQGIMLEDRSDGTTDWRRA